MAVVVAVVEALNLRPQEGRLERVWERENALEWERALMRALGSDQVWERTLKRNLGSDLERTIMERVWVRENALE